MSQQQQGIIEDQPLKVLGLFPRRQLTSILFNEQKFLKLYDSLCCTICRQLFNNPVYLKCSHRFCKQCIEKYIRFTDKKSCPNCRGDLNTKRDLRLDYGTATLISYAFGNRTKFCEDMAEVENAEAINLQLSTSKSSILISSVIRVKSFAEQQLKSPKKKVKTFQTLIVPQDAQTKGRKKKSRSIENSKGIEDSPKTDSIRFENNDFTILQKLIKTDDKLSITKLTSHEIYKLQQSRSNIEDTQKSELFEVVKSVKKKRGRKKQIPALQIKSFSQDEMQQINANSDLTPTNFMQNQQKNQQKQLQALRTIQNLKYFQQKSTQKPLTELQTRFESFQKQKKCLKDEFGDNYMFTLMKVPLLDFIIEIQLQKHPNCFFTPLLSCKSIQISAKSKIHHLFVLMSKLLNVSIKNVKLYINSQPIEQLQYQQSNQKSICQINQEIWKSVTDVQVFDMKQILSTLEDTQRQNAKYHNQSRQKYQKKKLFQGIEIDKQQKQTQPRKRGRGRSRKIQQKQNIISGKQDFKRVIYYRLCIQ